MNLNVSVDMVMEPSLWLDPSAQNFIEMDWIFGDKSILECHEELHMYAVDIPQVLLKNKQARKFSLSG
jgi:hypothetical protein